MTRKRAPDFDLRKALLDPGFTPRAGDAGALLDLLAGDGESEAAAGRALLRLGPEATPAAIARAEAPGPGRAAALRLLGRLGSAVADPAIAAALIARLDDADERVRRAAATALGKARPEGAGPALAAALGRETSASTKRALVEALGKAGGEVALAELRADAERAGPAAGSEHARASLMATRTLAREAPWAIAADRAPAAPLLVALHCRTGLEAILEAELPGDLGARRVDDAPAGLRLEGMLKGPPITLFQARTLLSFGFPLERVRVAGSDPIDAVIASLSSPRAQAILRGFTEGPLRYRLDLRRGGKRRAAVWRVAEEVQRRVPDLLNDPTGSPWDAVVYEYAGWLRVELVPNVPDPRFAYRRGDVPAASHPTIAAALARAGGARADDVAWDPFVGSGLELCERAILGPYRALVGSDIDEKALAVARANLDAAGAPAATLLHGDARTLVPPGPPPTLIVSNPPLGRRVQRSGDLGLTLERFVAHAAELLAPGGRIAWISPFPRRTREAAEAKGMTVTMAQEVDMGGFAAEMQVLAKPPRRR